MFIVATGLDELLVELSKVVCGGHGQHMTYTILVKPSKLTFLLRILSNQLNQLRPDGQRLVVELGNLLFAALISRCSAHAILPYTQQREQLLDISDLRKHFSLHGSISLQLFRRRVLQLFNIVEREDTRLAPQAALPPILVHALQHGNDIARPESQLAGLTGREIIKRLDPADRGSCSPSLCSIIRSVRSNRTRLSTTRCLGRTASATLGSALVVFQAQSQGHLQLIVFLSAILDTHPLLDRLARRRQSRVSSSELFKCLFHDAQIRVFAKHVDPFSHPLHDFGFDSLVCVAIVGQSQQGVGEAARGELAVKRRSAVLRECIGEFECVELDIGIAVRQSLDQCCYHRRGALGRC